MNLLELLKLNEEADLLKAVKDSGETILRSKPELKERMKKIAVNYINEIKKAGKTATLTSFKQSITDKTKEILMADHPWIEKAMKRFGYKDQESFWNDVVKAAYDIEVTPYSSGLSKRELY
jgi:hypothetical protein